MGDVFISNNIKDIDLYTYDLTIQHTYGEKAIVACAMVDILRHVDKIYKVINPKVLPESRYVEKFNSEKQKIENYNSNCIVLDYDSLEECKWFYVNEFTWFNRDGMAKQLSHEEGITYYWENTSLYRKGANTYYRSGVGMHYEDGEKIIEQDEDGNITYKYDRKTKKTYTRISAYAYKISSS
jgi:hypothetical protein